MSPRQADEAPNLAAAPGHPVRVRFSDRARHLRLTVSPDRGAELVAPRGTGHASMRRMVARNREWILRKTRQMDAVAERNALGLNRPGVAWLGGEALPIRRVGGQRSRVGVRNGALEVAGADEPAAISRWYRREARTRLGACVEQEARRLGIRPGRISVRDQRTRWGSCSPKGDLSFSWRLALGPPEVMRYVVIHELCHITELNHSPRFWALLDRAMPGWQEWAGWLREHSYELGSYEPRPLPAG